MQTTFLEWLFQQRNLTGDKQVVAEFAKAIHGSIIKIGFATNQPINCRKLWMLMGDLRNSPGVHLGFLATYVMYMTDTGNTDKDVDYVIDEITEMMEMIQGMSKTYASQQSN